MDTRRFLLAEHYDSLGLFKIADSMEQFYMSTRTCQNTSDPSRGGLDDPSYPVQKPKPLQKPKPNTNKKENILVPQKEKNNSLEIAQNAIEKAQPVLQPMNIIFSASEIRNASKEAINNYALALLKKVAKNGSISAKQSGHISSILKNSNNLNSEVIRLLQNSVNNKVPNILEVNAIKPDWLDNVKSAVKQSESFINKLKAYASKNPSQALLAKKTSEELGKKLSFWAKASKAVPTGLVLLNAIMLFPSAVEYFQKISQGGLDEILNDAEKRAKFIIFLSDVVSSVTIFFPPLTPVTSALYAISMGTSAGMYAFDQYREFTGEKKKDELVSNFGNLPTAKFLIPQSIQEKYLYTARVDPKNPKQPLKFTNIKTNENNFYQNISLFVKYYVDSLNNIEAAYAIKMIVWPEIKRIIDNKLGEGKPIDLKVSSIRNLPALFSGKTVSIPKKNGKYVERKIPPIDFIVDKTTPENAEALFAFNTAVAEIVNAINKADKLTFEDIK
jgi:hypothetical protein